MAKRGTAPHILYLGSTLRWVVNFTLQLHISGKEVTVSKNRRLLGPNCQSEPFGEEKNFSLSAIEPRIIQHLVATPTQNL